MSEQQQHHFTLWDVGRQRLEVSTLRQRLWKLPAVLAAGARRRVLRLSVNGPWGEGFSRVLEAVRAFVGQGAGGRAEGEAAAALPV
jgi:hypothetical protein